jgi:hypothetical protein
VEFTAQNALCCACQCCGGGEAGKPEPEAAQAPERVKRACPVSETGGFKFRETLESENVLGVFSVSFLTKIENIYNVMHLLHSKYVESPYI